MSRTTALAVALVAVVAVAIGGYLVYDNVLRGDAAAPLTLPSAAPSASTAAADPTGSVDPSDDASADPTTSAGASTGTGTGSGDLAGDWTVASGSLAGYRVREQLANLPAESDAVGRTDQVTGTITLAGSGNAVQLTAALFPAAGDLHGAEVTGSGALSLPHQPSRLDSRQPRPAPGQHLPRLS